MPQPRSRLMPRAAFVALVISTILTGWARADGGLLRHWERQSVYEIAVFTMPTPVTAGAIDISVLLLDRTSGAPVPDATIEIEVAPVSARDRAIRRLATTAAATNKLFRSALIDLPAAGDWLVHVEMRSPRGKARVDFHMEVSNPPPQWFLHWRWICWPVGVVVFYAIHQWLVHLKTDGRARIRKSHVAASR